MCKNMFILVIVIFLTFSDVLCQEKNNVGGFMEMNDSSELLETARTKKIRHALFSIWGLQGLAFAFWIKVKLIIVSFIIGSAIFLGLRHAFPKHSCSHEIISETPYIRYDHGPAFYEHEHDEHKEQAPYSLDRSSKIVSENLVRNQPYSGYYDPQNLQQPNIHRMGRRSIDKEEEEKPEEQIAEFLFLFLGLKSSACRSRFICEMEFRSNDNALTRMAFRMVGRSMFEKYLNEGNQNGQAGSFRECAAVNADCDLEEGEEEEEEEEEYVGSSTTTSEQANLTGNSDGSFGLENGEKSSQVENIMGTNDFSEFTTEKLNDGKKSILPRKHRLRFKRGSLSR